MSKILSGYRIRAIIALGLAGLAGLVFVPRLINVESTEAVLNGRAVVLRAPIDGQVSWSDAAVGDPVAAEDAIGEVAPLRDAGTLQEETRLRADLAGAHDRLKAIVGEQSRLDAMENELLGQSDTWKSAAIIRAHQTLAAAEAAVAAARRSAAAAAKEAKTTAEMAKNGVVGSLEVDRTSARSAEAASALAGAQAALKKAKVEAETAEAGLNLLDGQNDVPYSRQRLNDITLKRTELAARLADIAASARSLEAQIAGISDAMIRKRHVRSPIDGVLFRRLAAGGSDVIKGQEIAVLVDCSDLFIEARLPMDEAADIAVGAEARVEIAGRPGALVGTVKTARGWAPGSATDANASVLQAPDSKRWVLLEIAIDATALRIGDESYCRIGSGAKVSFDRSFFADFLD